MGGDLQEHERLDGSRHSTIEYIESVPEILPIEERYEPTRCGECSEQDGLSVPLAHSTDVAVVFLNLGLKWG